MSYGWDVAPRLLTIGIWKEVELLAFEDARLEDVWLRTRSADERTAEVSAPWRCGARGQVRSIARWRSAGRAPIDARGSPDGTPAGGRVPVHRDRPRLWWPNGAESRTCTRAGGSLQRRLSDRRALDGVRDPHAGAGAGAAADNATSFFLKVNGRRIFAQGFNWTAPDSIFARLDEPATTSSSPWCGSGANMLRVIGIGIYEKEPFYRLCDRRGILLWHDFMLTNFMYPQSDRAFMANLLEEVRFVVRACVRTLLRCGAATTSPTCDGGTGPGTASMPSTGVDPARPRRARSRPTLLPPALTRRPGTATATSAAR